MSRAGRSMSAEEFRRHGRAVVEWIARYMEEVERYPVLSQVRPGQVAASLPAEPPREGEAFERILADLDRVVMPGITHWQHPGFFAYFPANADGASILGDLVSAGPLRTRLEQHSSAELAQLLDTLCQTYHRRRNLMLLLNQAF